MLRNLLFSVNSKDNILKDSFAMFGSYNIFLSIPEAERRVNKLQEFHLSIPFGIISDRG